MSKVKRSAATARKLVVDLLVGTASVSLRLRLPAESAQAVDQQIELPVSPSRGARDPNYRVLQAMYLAAEEEVARQIQEFELGWFGAHT